ncbi:hypothetical protein [Streptococcus ruminantium]|nr:hypothetical protein [Streptococcus ruminantium]
MGRLCSTSSEDTIMISIIESRKEETFLILDRKETILRIVDVVQLLI